MHDVKYDDIIEKVHHISNKRSCMKISGRAAQFMPFSALSGHNEAISREERITCEKSVKSEESLEYLDLQIARLLKRIDEHPDVSIEYFVPDNVRDGGIYTKITDNVERLDSIKRVIILKSGKSIAFDDISDIKSSIFNDYENEI